MCGIVAVASQTNIVSILADGLKHLEYRGYDSSGIALIQNKNICSYKKEGNVSELTQSLDKKLSANIGIAHTRWATHGKPSKENAHPHISDDNIAIVHNGIIENYLEIKNKFFKDVVFASETDSEILAHLINFYTKENEIFEAVYLTLKEVKGSYAIAVLDKKNSDKAKKRFSKEIENNKIEILEGNSSLIIEDVLRKYRNIDVIYLDAHFHGEGPEYAPLDKEIECIVKSDTTPLVIIDDYFHIKKKIANSWTKYHDAKDIFNRLEKISEVCSELPYSFKGRYNSYLISKKISFNIILFQSIKSFILSLPKNLVKLVLNRPLN